MRNGVPSEKIPVGQKKKNFIQKTGCCKALNPGSLASSALHCSADHHLFSARAAKWFRLGRRIEHRGKFALPRIGLEPPQMDVYHLPHGPLPTFELDHLGI